MGSCDARHFLLLVHSIVGIVALGIIASSSWLISKGDDYIPFDYGPATWYAYMPLAFGLLVLILAIIGCRCTHEGAHIFLAFYASLQLLSGMVIMLCGSMMLALSTTWIDNILHADFPTYTVPPGIANLNKDFSDVIIGLYTVCCDKEAKECSRALVEQGEETYCVENVDAFNRGHTAALRDSRYCKLHDVNASCVGGSVIGERDSDPFFKFVKVNRGLLRDSVYNFGWLLVLFAVVLFMASVASCYLGIKHPRFKPRKHNPKDYQREEQEAEKFYSFIPRKEGEIILS